jgi:predicted dienelactone hydrolase
VVPIPGDEQVESFAFEWHDTARQRPIPARLVLPALPPQSSSVHASTSTSTPLPLVILSHGLGGSRDGYTYLGRYWAAHGYAVVHVQHVGSDRGVWMGNPLNIASRLQTAARDSEAIARAADVRFALNHMLAPGDALASVLKRRPIDPQRIAIAGHSYGANTALLVSGAQVTRGGQSIQLHDARIRAAVIISAPPFYGETDFAPILGHITLPSLHITSTGDDILVPGYSSAYTDRIRVFDAMGGRDKWLAVFRDGSHSMFTDRLGTGGLEWNPRVKIATQQLSLAFLDHALKGGSPALLNAWGTQHTTLLSRFQPGS